MEITSSQKSQHDLYIERLEALLAEIFSVWEPLPGQALIIKAFFYDMKDGVFIKCGRKFGKTDVAIVVIYIFAILFEGSECYYILDEKEHGRKVCWENRRLPGFFISLKQRRGESKKDYLARRKRGQTLHAKYIKKENNANMMVYFKSGSIVFVEGSKNYSSADGLSPTIGVYDEFKDHDKKYDDAMRPNLDAVDGRLLIVGTPPPEEGVDEHNYHRTADEFRLSKTKELIHAPSYLNHHVYPGGRHGEKFKAIEKRYKDRGEYHIFSREYLAISVADSQRSIFPMLSETKHRASYDVMLEHYLNSHRDWEVYLGFDPGTTKCFAGVVILINKKDYRVWLMDEIYEKDQAKTVSSLIWKEALKIIKPIEPDPRQLDDIIYDVAAAWFANEILNQKDIAMNPCEKHLLVKEDQLSVIKDSMLTNRFKISSKCKFAWSEFKGYSKKDDGTIPKEDDHIIDTVRYILGANNYESVPADKISHDIPVGRFATPASDRDNFVYDDDNDDDGFLNNSFEYDQL